MRLHWTEIAAATVLAGAGCAVIFAGLRRAMRLAIAERERSTDRQIAALATTVKALEGRVAELNRQASERPGELASVVANAEAENESRRELKPEMLAVITAAATAFVGKTAHIRSAKLVPANDPVSAWTQQGRSIVQSSHNLHGRD